MSRTISFGLICKYKGGNIDTNYCLEISPESKDFCRYLCNSLNILLFLNCCLLVLIENTISPGYHFKSYILGIYFG